ncbi:MAG: radical SAM protein [Actinomycetota bacterium]|nr:radical SAM protein [Actinomycetota bacterium]
MRWDNLLTDNNQMTAKLPLFADEAVVRSFKTPEFKGMTFYEVNAKSIINHVAGDRFGFNWTINPYRGCSHSCVYCFARPTHTYLDFNSGSDFDTKIVVKVNAVELLRTELRRKSWPGASIAMGTNTDPYQRAEGHYRLTRKILIELNAARNPYSILTKGTLIQRDIDVLVEGASMMDVSTCFSVGTIDDDVWRMTEPGTPHPLKRLEVVRRLNEAGVPCGVLMAPILPGISDDPDLLKRTVEAIAEAGATSVSPIVLHLRKGVKEEFMSWLEDAFPHLTSGYMKMYGRTTAPKEVTAPIGRVVAATKSRLGYATNLVSAKSADAAPNMGAAQSQLALDLMPSRKRKAPKWVKDPLTTGH